MADSESLATPQLPAFSGGLEISSLLGRLPKVVVVGRGDFPYS